MWNSIINLNQKSVSIMPLKYLVSTKITDGPHETPFLVNDGIPFLSVDAIQNGELIVSNDRMISLKDANLYGKKCQPIIGDILIGKAASTGKIALVKTNQLFSIWSPLALVRVNKLINNRFMAYFLKSNLGQEQIDFFATTNTQKNISMKDLERVKVSIPSIEKQIIISNFLDEKVATIDRLIDMNLKQIEYSHLFLKNSIKKIIENIKTLNYEEKRLQDIADFKKGPFGSSLKKEMFVEESLYTYKVYEQQHAIKKSTNLGEYYISKSKFNELRGFEVEANDIIVSCAGTIGMTYIIPTEAKKGIINQALMRVKVKKKIVLNEFFQILFDDFIEEVSLVNSNGSAIKNIPPFSVLNKIRVNIPPIKEQEKIIENVFKLKNDVSKLIDVKENKIQLLKEYKKSMIYEYITGKKQIS